MEEERRFVRLDTRLEMSYALLPSDEEKRTVTKNISGGGICMFADHPMDSGTKLKVSLSLPDRKEPINFIGQVVWSEEYDVVGKTERKHTVEIGLQFSEISQEDQMAILRHVILRIKPA